jgi:hypothetical protein
MPVRPHPPRVLRKDVILRGLHEEGVQGFDSRGVAGGGSSRLAPEQLLSGFILWSWAREEKDNAEAQRAPRLAEEWGNSWVRAEDLGICGGWGGNSAPSQTEGCGTQEAIGLKS